MRARNSHFRNAPAVVPGSRGALCRSAGLEHGWENNAHAEKPESLGPDRTVLCWQSGKPGVGGSGRGGTGLRDPSLGWQT